MRPGPSIAPASWHSVHGDIDPSTPPPTNVHRPPPPPPSALRGPGWERPQRDVHRRASHPAAHHGWGCAHRQSAPLPGGARRPVARSGRFLAFLHISTPLHCLAIKHAPPLAMSTSAPGYIYATSDLPRPQPAGPALPAPQAPRSHRRSSSARSVPMFNLHRRWQEKGVQTDGNRTFHGGATGRHREP
jgi:hypothetical protein